MSVKYRDYGLTKEEARKAIELAYHLKQHELFSDAHRASHDGIRRANFHNRQVEHAVQASMLIHRNFNSYLSIREY